MLGSLAAQYVETPLFVVNSKFDTWQEKAIIGVNCTVSKCPKPEQDFWAAYGKHSKRALFCWRLKRRFDKKIMDAAQARRWSGCWTACRRNTGEPRAPDALMGPVILPNIAQAWTKR